MQIITHKYSTEQLEKYLSKNATQQQKMQRTLECKMGRFVLVKGLH